MTETKLCRRGNMTRIRVRRAPGRRSCKKSGFGPHTERRAAFPKLHDRFLECRRRAVLPSPSFCFPPEYKTGFFTPNRVSRFNVPGSSLRVSSHCHNSTALHKQQQQQVNVHTQTFCQRYMCSFTGEG